MEKHEQESFSSQDASLGPYEKGSQESLVDQGFQASPCGAPGVPLRAASRLQMNGLASNLPISLLPVFSTSPEYFVCGGVLAD